MYCRMLLRSLGVAVGEDAAARVGVVVVDDAAFLAKLLLANGHSDILCLDGLIC